MPWGGETRQGRWSGVSLINWLGELRSCPFPFSGRVLSSSPERERAQSSKDDVLNSPPKEPCSSSQTLLSPSSLLPPSLLSSPPVTFAPPPSLFPPVERVRTTSQLSDGKGWRRGKERGGSGSGRSGGTRFGGNVAVHVCIEKKERERYIWSDLGSSV